MNQDRLKAFGGSALIYAVIVTILFVLPGFSYVKEIPLEEEGVMVSLGDPESGGPGMLQGDPESTPQNSQASGSNEENPITQSVEEANEMQSNPQPQSESPNPTQPDLPELTLAKHESQKVVDSRRLMSKGKTGQGGTTNTPGPGEGAGKNPGMEGEEDGTKGAPPGSGGSGTSWKLSGRKPVTIPRIEDNINVSGVVVVKILVNQEGKVIEAIGNQAGTTISNAAAIRRAERYAMNFVWSVKEDAPDVQEGEIRVKFVTSH